MNAKLPAAATLPTVAPEIDPRIAAVIFDGALTSISNYLLDKFASGEIALNEELAEFRLIAPEKLRPWDFGTGLAVRDWLARRLAAAG